MTGMTKTDETSPMTEYQEIDEGYSLRSQGLSDNVAGPVAARLIEDPNKNYLRISVAHEGMWAPQFDLFDGSYFEFEIDEKGKGPIELYIYEPHIRRFGSTEINEDEYHELVFKSYDYATLRRIVDCLPVEEDSSSNDAESETPISEEDEEVSVEVEETHADEEVKDFQNHEVCTVI